MIRSGRPADEPRLRALQSHLCEPSPTLLAYGLGAGGVLVSVDDAGRPVGYVLTIGSDRSTLHPAPDSPTGDVVRIQAPIGTGRDGDARTACGDDRATGSCHVAELVVAPGYRREGRATALLSAVVESDHGRVTIAVAADNREARALYRRLGFERVGRDPSYFESGPALLLERD